MHIYKITNLINGKIYIGKEKGNNPSYLGSGLLIQCSIKKYGKENFTKEIIEECEDIIHLNAREKFWILYYNSRDKKIGYNIHEGGHGGMDSDETKEKISLTIKKLWEDTKSIYNSVGYRKNLSEGLKNRQCSEEYAFKRNERLKNNPPWKDKKFTEEHKQKIGDGVRGDKNGMYGKYTDSMAQNLIPFIKGHDPWNKNKTNVYSDNTLKKMSESAKNRNISEESSRNKSRKLSEYHKTHPPSWSYKVVDTRTGIEYTTINQCRNSLSLTEYMYKKLVKQGILIATKNDKK